MPAWIDGLLWHSARPLITDLWTIRADRGRCYYQINMLFRRRPVIKQALSQEGRGLMPTWIDGRLSRARVMENSLRRGNCHAKHRLWD